MEIDIYKNKQTTQILPKINTLQNKLYIRRWRGIGQNNNWSVPITPALLESWGSHQYVNRNGNQTTQKNNHESTEPYQPPCLAHQISHLRADRETFHVFILLIELSSPELFSSRKQDSILDERFTHWTHCCHWAYQTACRNSKLFQQENLLQPENRESAKMEYVFETNAWNQIFYIVHIFNHSLGPMTGSWTNFPHAINIFNDHFGRIASKDPFSSSCHLSIHEKIVFCQWGSVQNSARQSNWHVVPLPSMQAGESHRACFSACADITQSGNLLLLLLLGLKEVN